jgi:acetyltransferase-like isoleucine patch superfamily enzyme
MANLFEQLAPSPRDFARCGEGSWIVPPCEVVGADKMSIGESVVILEHSTLRASQVDPTNGPRLVVGNGVRLGRFLTIVCEVGVVLEDGVSSSDCVAIRDTWRDLAGMPDGVGGLGAPEPGPVQVGKGAYLGYGCVVGPGVSIGEGAFVGEGAVVVEDVPPFTVVYGNPAVVIRRYDSETTTWIGPRWP